MPKSMDDLEIGNTYEYRPRAAIGHGMLETGDKVKVVDIHPHRGPQPIEVEILEGEHKGSIVYLLFADCLFPVS